MSGEDYFDFCCSDCGYWELAYVSKSGQIGCHDCGIHPDLADEPTDDEMADQDGGDQ